MCLSPPHLLLHAGCFPPQSSNSVIIALHSHLPTLSGFGVLFARLLSMGCAFTPHCFNAPSPLRVAPRVYNASHREACTGYTVYPVHCAPHRVLCIRYTSPTQRGVDPVHCAPLRVLCTRYTARLQSAQTDLSVL